MFTWTKHSSRQNFGLDWKKWIMFRMDWMDWSFCYINRNRLDKMDF